MMREYAFNYTENNRERLKDFGSWEEAAKYLSGQPLVDNLVEYAYRKGIRRQPYLIEEARKLLQTQLTAFVIRNIYGDDGFYPIFQKDDMIIKEAIRLIKANKATPEAIGKEQYLDKGKLKSLSENSAGNLKFPFFIDDEQFRNRIV